jgi:hypothetical protein
MSFWKGISSLVPLFSVVTSGLSRFIGVMCLVPRAATLDGWSLVGWWACQVPVLACLLGHVDGVVLAIFSGVVVVRLLLWC